MQNWRKLAPSDQYPRFAELFPQFLNSWKLFGRIVKEIGIGEIVPDQFELTYINHIAQGEGWTNISDLSAVFPDIQCKKSGFLPEPEKTALRRTYKLPHNKGRFHVSIQQALNRQTKQPLLVLDITARGYSSDISEWFILAHEWIVKGFADLTGQEVQNSVWKKVK